MERDEEKGMGKERDIMKFRAWIPDYTESARMVYTDAEDNGDVYFSFNELGHVAVYELRDRIVDGYHDGCDSIERTDAIIMAYTGLRDKNGLEIWEGDIVRWWLITGWGLHAVVKLSTAEVADDVFATGWMAENSPVDENCYVCGNIYENPELLEEVMT